MGARACPTTYCGNPVYPEAVAENLRQIKARALWLPKAHPYNDVYVNVNPISFSSAAIGEVAWPYENSIAWLSEDGGGKQTNVIEWPTGRSS